MGKGSSLILGLSRAASQENRGRGGEGRDRGVELEEGGRGRGGEGIEGGDYNMNLPQHMISSGAIPWLMVAELFMQEARPIAISIATLVNWLANFVVGLVFPYILVSPDSYTPVLVT